MQNLQRAFNIVNSMSGQYSVSTIASASATEKLTASIAKNKFTYGQWFADRMTKSNVLKATLKEQIALQQASVVSFGRSASGKTMSSVLVPNNVISKVNGLRGAVSRLSTTVGFYSTVVQSASRAGAEWGRGLQRTGFQITQGIGMPIAALAVIAGATFYSVDKNLTNIAKVYDTSSDKILSKQAEMAKAEGDLEKARDLSAKATMAREKELADLRTSSFDNAREVASKYGTSINETLQAEGELAAAGATGLNLIKSTNEVQRIATLGQLDQNEALKATISIQSVFQKEANASGDAAGYLGDKFNLMNQIENQTSLSANDMVKAIPKVLPIIKELGGGMEEFVVLMTAMKAGGVDATEGANALKSGIGSLERPTKVTLKALREMGVEMEDIPDKAGGDLLKMLEILGERTANLDKNSRVEAFYRIFGKEQASRMMILASQLKNINDETTQVGRAFQATKQDASEWAETADQEMARLQQSASMRFKKMISEIQGQLAIFGEPALEVGTTIVTAVNKIIKAFNKLPNSGKKLLIWVGVGTLVAGALFLVVGAFTNLLLTMTAFGAGLVTMITRFKLLTPAALAARTVTNNTSNAVATQGTAFQTTSAKIRAYIDAMRGAAAVQAGMRVMTPGGGTASAIAPAASTPVRTYGTGVMGTPNFVNIAGGGATSAYGSGRTDQGILHQGGYYNAVAGTGKRKNSPKQLYTRTDSATGQVSAVSAKNYERIATAAQKAEDATAKAAAQSKAMAQQTAATRIGFMGIASAAAGLMFLGPAMKTFKDESAGATEKLAMAGVLLLSFGPLIGGIAAGIKTIGATALASGFKAAGLSLVGMLGPVGLIAIGIAGVGIAIYSIIKRMDEWKKKSAEINDSAKDWGDIFGYAVVQMDTAAAKQGKTINVQQDNANKLKESNKSLYESLRNIKDEEEAITAARREGYKVSLTGGNRDQVEQAMRTALHIAGVDGSKQDIAINANLDLTVGNAEEVQANLNNEINKMLDEALTKASSENRSWFSKLMANADISEEARMAASQAAAEFSVAFGNAQSSDERGVMLKNFITSWNKEAEGAFAVLKGKYNRIFTTLNINNATDLAKQMRYAEQYQDAARGGAKLTGEAATYSQEKLAALSQLRTQAGRDAAQLTETEKTLAKTIAGGGDAAADSAKGVYTLDSLYGKYDTSANAVASSSNSAASGIENVGEASEEAAAQVETVSEATKALQDNLRDALKSTMNSTMDAVYQAFADKREKDQQATLDRIEADGQARLDRLDAAQERKEAEFDARKEASDKDFENRNKVLDASQKAEDKAFEDHWQNLMDDHEKRFDDQKKAAEDAADAQIQAIEDQITAEEKQEELRERMFQAQQARMQRMSEMFNNSVDFNAALNSGNLDEAARVQNNSAATSIQWAADDTASLAGDASKQKREQLDAKKDEISKAKDARLEAIDELEDAEKKQLEDRKDREKEELQARQDALEERLKDEQEAWNKSLKQEQDRYKKSIDEQQKALQKQNDQQRASAQARFDTENASLEQQLAALKAYTPRNQQELNDHIAKLQGIYNAFGTNYIKPTGQSWGQVFGDAQKNAMNAAAVALREEIKWADIGTEITDGMASAFDLNSDQLLQWLKTGVYPAGAMAAPSTAGSSKGRQSNGWTGGQVKHSGGSVGWSSADRVGVPRSASPYPSEVPTLLKRGEFVMNERASRVFGPQLAAMNAEPAIRHKGGPIGSGISSVGLLGGAVAATLAQGIARTLSNTVSSMVAETGSYGTAAAGKYGNVNLSGEQLQNASIIMNVGKGMGASQRDLVVAIATAMQESQLKNLSYGDRDSVGLFQQRTSQGWGTVAQIMDPEYSARKFFEALFKVKNRDQLPVTVAAQRVQRSGFPNAYAKWEEMANAVVNGTPAMMNAAFMQGQNAGNARGLVAGISTQKGGYTYPALDQIMSRSGVPYQVTSTKRNKGDGSYHNKGMAIDFDDFSSPKIDTPGLYAIWQWLYKNFGSASTELIYAGPGATSIKNGSPFNYSKGTMDGHHNHVHWAMTPEALAKIGVPQLRVGGNVMFDDTLANLHAGETVLTKPLSQSLRDGINAMSSTNSSQIKIEINNPVLSEPGDIDRLANAVARKFDERTKRNGRERVVR